MKIGVVREIKAHENRIALTTAGADRLREAGHEVLVETGGGLGSGLADEAFVEAGARILPNSAAVFGEGELILKVKEPLEVEWPLTRPGQTLFTYFHLAASRELFPRVNQYQPPIAWDRAEGYQVFDAAGG